MSYTVEQRTAEIGPSARRRLRPHFERAGLAYPPARVVLLGLKHERRLEVYVEETPGRMRQVLSYPVLGASGVLGPKTREGDLQVPEGFYEVESLNPNSRYRVSLRVSYPNELDRSIAEVERRGNLGGDIMIHGGSSSVGCLAVGDRAAEELFVLAADSGEDNVEIVLAPVDFRTTDIPPSASEAFPDWVRGLHSSLRQAVRALPRRVGATTIDAIARADPADD